jgi:DNA-binding MarR family transcriptional regulator
MEEQDLVERVRSAEDRRVVRVRMTERGRALIDAVHGQHVEAQSTLLSDLAADEIAELDRLLRKVERSVVRHEAEVNPPSTGDGPMAPTAAV